jgi:hypothetical protein
VGCVWCSYLLAAAWRPPFCLLWSPLSAALFVFGILSHGYQSFLGRVGNQGLACVHALVSPLLFLLRKLYRMRNT